MSEIDRVSIEDRGIPGLELMERAGQRIADRILKTFPPETLHQTLIYCGPGNNGGDGFVIARHIAEQGLFPVIGLYANPADLRGDAKTNYDRAAQLDIPIHVLSGDESTDSAWNTLAASNRDQLVVDALLGTGAKGAPRGVVAKAIQHINQNKRTTVVSVDIPSGVESGTGAAHGDAVNADLAYSIGLPKKGHVLPPGLNYCARYEVLDIGFPLDLLEQADSEAELLTGRLIQQWLPKRDQSAHKGSEGHVLSIAGSRGMTGAALLCAHSALHSGAGLVSAACPASLLPIYAQSIWEMLTKPVEETETGAMADTALDAIFAGNYKYTTAIVGPGMGRHPSTQRLIQRIVQDAEIPLVIDGDGLNAVTVEMLQRRTAPWIATPHPGEMARLFGTTVEDIQADRWGFVQRLVGSSNGVAVLKGPSTAIASSHTPVFVNPTGNPGMASGGMGDVLSGMCGAFLAKGMEPIRAACCAVFLHGLSADLSMAQTGAAAVTARQAADGIQAAMRSVLDRFQP